MFIILVVFASVKMAFYSVPLALFSRASGLIGTEYTRQLGFKKTRYRGLKKQIAKFNIMFALANLILADRPGLSA